MGNWSFWLITVGITTMGLVLTAGGLQQGFQWMNGNEWLDTCAVDAALLAGADPLGHHHGYRDLPARHQPGDDGARAAGRGGATAPGAGIIPVPAGGSLNERTLHRPVRGRLLPAPCRRHQGILPFVEPSARVNRVTAVVRNRLRPAQMDGLQVHGLHALPAARPPGLSREVLLARHSQHVRP